MPDDTQPKNLNGDAPDTGESSAKKGNHKVGARAVKLVLLVVVVIIGTYLYTRAASVSQRIRLIHNESIEPNKKTVSETQLRILTWNIAHGRGVAPSNWTEGKIAKRDRVSEIAKYIRKRNPDVVVLNEVDFRATWSGGIDQADLIASEAGFPWCSKQCNLDFGIPFLRFQFGNAILSRYPIENVTALDTPGYRAWEDWLAGRKRGLSCSIRTPNGVVDVMGLHLEVRGDDSRVKSVQWLLPRMNEANNPLIVAGDLNSTFRDRGPSGKENDLPWSAVELLAQHSNLIFSPEPPVNKSVATFPAVDPRIAIDWIMFDPVRFRRVFEVVDQTTALSDHLPVMVDLSFRK